MSNRDRPEVMVKNKKNEYLVFVFLANICGLPNQLWMIKEIGSGALELNFRLGSKPNE